MGDLLNDLTAEQILAKNREHLRRFMTGIINEVSVADADEINFETVTYIGFHTGVGLDGHYFMLDLLDHDPGALMNFADGEMPQFEIDLADESAWVIYNGDVGGRGRRYGEGELWTLEDMAAGTGREWLETFEETKYELNRG